MDCTDGMVLSPPSSNDMVESHSSPVYGVVLEKTGILRICEFESVVVSEVDRWVGGE